MIHPLRDRLNRRRFRKAKAEAEANGHMVCATVDRSGRPLYFTLPVDTPDDVGEATAFALRHGRPISDGEQMLKSAARARHPASGARPDWRNLDG